jgi:ABC-2 type transport system ATP-binding protein
MRILTGYLPPTRGTAHVAGHDILTASHDARRAIGYLPEATPLYPEMRVDEYLDFRGRLHRMPRVDRRRRIDTVVDRCGLAPVRRRVICHLSKGNRQRVGLAQALLHEPPVLILDEPTVGLDPNQITEIRQLFRELRGRHTILLSTHILPEVERTADRAIVIARGRIVADGTIDELRRKFAAGGRVVIEVRAEHQAVERACRALDGVADVRTSTRDGWCTAAVTPADGRDLREALGKTITANAWTPREIRFETAGLEEFFARITTDQELAAQQSAEPQAA